MDYYSNANNYSYSSQRFKDYNGKKSNQNLGKSNHINYRDKFDSPKRQSLFVKLGMDLVQNQSHHEDNSNNQVRNQQKLMELPTNYKKNSLISNSIDNFNSNGKSFHKYLDKENDYSFNSNKISKHNVEYSYRYKKPNKKKNKNYYNSNIEGYDYEQIHDQSNTYDNDNINHVKFIGEDSTSYIMINFGESLIDLYYGIDSRHNTLINSKKYLNLLKEEILDKNIPIELFNNDSINKHFFNGLKLSSILMILIKFIILDFQYESNIKSLLRKTIKSLTDLIIHVVEAFILNPLFTTTNSISFTIQDKFTKFLKQNKQLKKSTNSELLIFYSKSNELTINLLKQISTSYFKVGFFRPVHNIINYFVTNLDKNKISLLIKLIIHNILFCHLTPYNHYSKQLYQNSYVQNFMSSLPTVPFLPPVKDYNYTLVLDLDETLVHFFYTPSGGSFLIRPYCMEFLETLSNLYEIVIFTAALKDYADTILDIMDRDFRLIKYRLYRNHTVMTNNGIVKVRSHYIRDLSKIGRDLSKVMIIDNLPENFRMQINNGLPIITWTDNMRDTQLRDLCIILEDIHKYKVSDVRVIIKRLKEEILKTKNVNNPYFKIDISKLM